MISESQIAGIGWEAVQSAAAELHRKAVGDSASLFGIFPPEEVEEWAQDWFLRFQETGGVMAGRKIANPLAALTAWLRACARKQSKRFREVARYDLETEPMPVPFGVE